MSLIKVFYAYITWHYNTGFFRIFHLWKNFSWFIVNLFSIPQLVRHLFAPFKRITEERTSKFDLEDMMGTFLVNILFRFVGFFIRSIVIILGTISLLLNTLISISVWIFWIFIPLILPGLIIGGLFLILNGISNN